MTFLNAALAFGSLALAIPIIIHLFHKSRFKIVVWGAMHLLEAVIRQNQRRIQMEQWILLAIRCAIPLLLALLMARPLWKGAAKLLGDTKTSTIILLDNSYSMEASRAGTSNWSLARDEAVRIVSELKQGSEVAIGLMGEGGAGLLDTPTYDTGRVLSALQKADAGFGPANVPASLDFAANTFDQMHESVRQVVVLTDFQRASFSPQEDSLIGQMLARMKKQASPPSVTLFDVGPEVRENVAVESLDFSRLMVGVGQKVQIRANIRNFGDQRWPELRINFRVDGKDKSAAQIKLGPREKGQVLFTHVFDTAGSHVVEVSADADSLKADNTYLASIQVRDRVPVLLVDGEPSKEALKSETAFAEIALQPFAAGRVELADLIKPSVIAPEAINPQLLNQSAVVILANVRKLNDGQLRALEEFVRNGGGLLVFPGSKIDAAWYQSALHRDGKGLLPLAYAELAGDAKAGATPASVVSQRFENPALELFNDPRNGSMADAAIRLWFKTKDAPASGGEPPVVLARLDTGDPLFVEKKFGEGRVIACSTALDADWGNLPMRPFYLPLLQRLTVYLASTIFPPRNLESGKPIAAFLPAADVDKKATLTLPGGDAVELKIARKGSLGDAEFARTQRPGLYTLTPPGGQPIHYVVNANRRESDTSKLTGAEIDALAKSHGVVLVRSSAEYKQLDQKRRFGTELWKPLLWALLIFFIAEMVLQQIFAGVRRKPAPLHPVMAR
ncbi:MAG: BatA domain-containing protein [Chthoniobacteraceae bacterium]